MDRKHCFGSLQQVSLSDGQTMTQSRPECRNCQEIRDCLRHTQQLVDEQKEKEELKKQSWITEIIDHSFVVSNELGSCLLKFLNKIYGSSIGAILFKNLFLFFDVPQNTLSSNLSISISRTMMGLLRGEKEESNRPPNPQASQQRRGLDEGFSLRIILFQKSFPNSQEANMGMIAYEAARALASDDLGVKQILQVLPDSEANTFRKLDLDGRIKWLIGKWGFLEEYEALKKIMALSH
ncbi:MAG TPA: hypothetical protein VMV04_17895 [Thermodesulfobacteriota bacterium]|nr:hypothetical protein [Thermodesulfobacteriota bacterium]